MELDYSEQHRALQDEVRAFIKANGDKAPSLAGVRKRPDAATLAWQRLLLEQGYVGRTVPRDYGGFGAAPDVLEAAIIAQEFTGAGISQGTANQGVSMLVPTLLEVGTEEQRRRWIELTLRGDIIWCQGYSEPGAGSDLASLKTHAHVDGGDFVINGQKIWTSSAHYADMIFVLVRTEPEARKHAGISYLLVPMDSPGIEVRPLKTMTGQATFNEVFFTDVRVPTDQIVMGRGDGWKVANTTLKYERLLLGDPNKMLNRFGRIRKLMEETTLNGVRLMDMPEYRDRLLRLQGEVMASKYHGMRLLTEAAKGEDSGVKRLIVKDFGTVLAHKLSALAVDVLGAAGLPYDLAGEGTDEASLWHNDYMYDIGLIIGGGSSQIQKNIISERGLGMPREPKVAAAKAP
ncbi:MAG: acyl-CoA dehydrogenase family protein [Rhodospirillales bacterium]|nr:acyl-CoA dehydrogenase family protein [Rhodospirillales bacterium]